MGLLLALGWKPQHRNHISTAHMLYLNYWSQPSQPWFQGKLISSTSTSMSSHSGSPIWQAQADKKCPSKMPFKKEAVSKEFSIFAIFFLLCLMCLFCVLFFFFSSWFFKELNHNSYIIFRIAFSAQFWQKQSGSCRELNLESEVKLTTSVKRHLWKLHGKYLPAGMIT